jgi:hypothetical protein
MADATAAADAAKAKEQDAQKQRRDVNAKVGPVYQAYRSYLVALYGNAVEPLADFGLAPHKARTPQTSEQKAVSAAKRKATRAARHTAGAKQKKGVKGAVTAALVVTPQSAPQPASTSPTPSAGTPTRVP